MRQGRAVEGMGFASPVSCLRRQRRFAPLQLAATLALLLTAAGCVTLPPVPRVPQESDVPRAWSVPMTGAQDASRVPTSLKDWWTRFDDPLLSSLIGEALVANTSIQSAQANVAQAWALRGVAQAGLTPSLTGAASARRDTTGLANASASSSDRFSLGVDANWTLDVYGGRRAALLVSDGVVWARVADLGDMQVQVAAELAANYIVLRSSQARATLSQQNLISQSATLQIALWRQAAGLGTALDTLQARALVAQTRAGIPSLTQAIETAAHAISVLTGQPPASLNARLLSVSAMPQSRGDLTIAIPAETLRQRADVRAGEYGVLQAYGRLGQSQAATKPSFVLGGSFGFGSSNLGRLVQGSSVLSAVLGSISLPIMDGGASAAQVRAEEAAYAQSRYAYRAIVLGALKDVEDAMVALRDDTVRVGDLRVAAQAATQAARLAQVRYRSGLIDYQAVLETQRTALSTQDSLATATASISSDQINLYKALGGGWAAPVNLPPPMIAEGDAP